MIRSISNFCLAGLLSCAPLTTASAQGHASPSIESCDTLAFLVTGLKSRRENLHPLVYGDLLNEAMVLCESDASKTTDIFLHELQKYRHSMVDTFFTTANKELCLLYVDYKHSRFPNNFPASREEIDQEKETNCRAPDLSYYGLAKNVFAITTEISQAAKKSQTSFWSWRLARSASQHQMEQTFCQSLAALYKETTAPEKEHKQAEALWQQCLVEPASTISQLLDVLGYSDIQQQRDSRVPYGSIRRDLSPIQSDNNLSGQTLRLGS